MNETTKFIQRLRLVRYLPLYVLLGFLVATAGCGSDSPFTFVRVSGKVTYEDGTPIPAALSVTFHPVVESTDNKPRPRPAAAFVEKETGELGPVTSYNPGDGLPEGKYKVTLMTRERTPLPPSIVPPEYGNPQSTPLMVDTTVLPFDLKVRKPG